MPIESGKENLTSITKIESNPEPLTFSSFALTTFILSIHMTGSSKVMVPNIVLGTALFYGGLMHIIAGLWDFHYGHTLGATISTSFGAFWLSYGIILIPSFGIRDAYATQEDFENASGVYLAGWTIFAFLMVIASLRTTVAKVALHFFTFLTLLLLTIGNFVHSKNSTYNDVTIAGGYVGIITSLLAWYNSLAGLLTKDYYFTLPVWDLKKNQNSNR